MNDDLKCLYCSNEKPLGFSFIMETRMQIDEHIDLFSPYKLTDEDVYVISGNDLKEALALAEKSRWKYPEKGELPEKELKVYFITDTFTPDHIGKRCGLVNDYFWCQIQRRSYEINEVKAWTYAPVLDEEPLPRSERLEQLTAERDALLKEDQ